MNTDGTEPKYIWACQGALFGEPTIIGFGERYFKVKEIERDDANRLVIANHYSKTVYSASTIHLGLIVDKEVRGVLQFGCAMNPLSMGSVVEGTKYDEYLELNRMWLDDGMPRNSETKAISYAVKFIRRKFPKVAWIQSFADERCGRFGVVYQAASFLYCGEHTSTFWELDGQMYHNSLMTDSRRAETPYGKRLRENKERAIPHEFRQFRYVKPLKNWARRRLLLPVLPYPKPDAAKSA